jgi:hypothetical protein
MSVRSRSVAATVAATALLAAGAAVVPAAADAASLPFAYSLVNQHAGQKLMPGGVAGTLTMKLTNTTSKAEKFSDSITLWGQGAVALKSGDVTLRVTPRAGTPAVSSTPGAWGAYITIPAHATFTWTVSVQATKAWPVKDNGVGVQIGVRGQSHSFTSKKQVNFAVGRVRTA